MNVNTKLIILPDPHQGVLELVGINRRIDKTINALAKLCKVWSPNIKAEMIQIARSIASDHPTYLNAYFVLGCLLIARTNSYEPAGEFLYRAWLIGHRAVLGTSVTPLPYTAFVTNSAFLSSGAMLAEYFVRHGTLADALVIADMMASLDVEHGSSAMFVQGHVHQLMGKKTAIETLEAVARGHQPMAYYGLGLEQLRTRRGKDAAQSSFSMGLETAPAVGAILLSRQELNATQTRIQQRDAAQYVESFCLSEWSASEIDALDDAYVKDKPSSNTVHAMAL